MNNRENCEEFIHEYYSKASYAKAYAPIIKSMSSAFDRKNTPLIQHPSPYKRLPRRPSKKKRRLEPGEKSKGKKQKGNSSADLVDREIGKQVKCSFCKQLGHNKRKCKSTKPAPPEPKKKNGRPPLTDDWSARLRAQREKQQEAAGTQASQASTVTQASQASNILDGTKYPDSPTPMCV